MIAGLRAEKRPRIMVVGSSNTDMVVKMDRLPHRGETVLGGRFITVPGGKGANQAVAAARLGASVTFVGRLGMDGLGDSALANLEAEGIDTRWVVRDPDEASGVALILVDACGENIIAVASGANSRLAPADVEAASDVVSECSALLLQLETPLDTVEYAARLARERGVDVILNSAPMPPDGLPRHLLELVDVIVPNESETRTLLGLDPGAEIDECAARELPLMGIERAVITLGSRGAMVLTDGMIEIVPAPVVEAADATAAGDAFTGALAVGLSSGMDLVAAAGLAVKAASLSVTRIGAQSSLPTAEELARFRPEYRA